MRKCGLFALLSVALSLGFSTLFFDVSKAQSAFDDTYKTTDQLLIKHHASEIAYDVTENVYEILYGTYGSGEGQLPVEFYDFYNKSSGSAINITDDMERRNDLLSLWNNDKKYWSESQRTNYISYTAIKGTRYYVEMCAVLDHTENASAVGNFLNPGNISKYLKFQPTNVLSMEDTLKIEISLMQDTNGSNERIRVDFSNPKVVNDCILSTEIQDPDEVIANNDIYYKTTATNLYAYMESVNYPQDYLGKQIRDTFNPLNDPTFTAEVDGYRVKLKDTTPLSRKQSSKIDLCMFQVPNNTFGDNFTEYTYDCEDPPEIEHEFTQLGNYRVILRMYSSEEDTWYDATESVIIEQTLYPTFKYKVDNYDITLQDVTPIGVLNDNKIDLCMFQVPDNPYGDSFTEYTYDCEQKPEIEHTFTEYANYRVILRMYSSETEQWHEHSESIKVDGSTHEGIAGGAPQDDPMYKFVNSLDDFNSFGITQILVLPINFLAQLPKLAGNCHGFTIPFFGGKELNVECQQQYYRGLNNTLVNFYQTILTAVIGYGIASRIFKDIREIQDPQNDRVEVQKL